MRINYYYSIRVDSCDLVAKTTVQTYRGMYFIKYSMLSI